jgi:hypothetical protein
VTMQGALGLQCHWKNTATARTYKAGKRLHALRIQLSYSYTAKGSCMSTTVIGAIGMCFSLISKGGKKFRSSMLRSAGKGRAEM